MCVSTILFTYVHAFFGNGLTFNRSHDEGRNNGTALVYGTAKAI